MKKNLVGTLVAIFSMRIASAEDIAPPVTVYAAGSVTGALADIAKHFSDETGQVVRIVSGPAGILRRRIEQGEAADVFVSANMTHPETLATEGKGTVPIVFASNTLCVLTLPGSGITSDNLVDSLLAPGVRIGTSTPGTDPGGDYAWAFFAKAETVRPGARAALESKAQKLVGGAMAPKIPGNANAVSYFLEHHDVDVFFGYCSSHDAAPDPALRKVEVPRVLAVPVDYGMSVVLRDNNSVRLAAAYRFAWYLMTPASQSRLARYGFKPATTASY